MSMSVRHRNSDVYKRQRERLLNLKALESSYLTSLRIAKAEKPHSTGGELNLPAYKDIAETMFDEKEVKQLDLIPLSTIQCVALLIK